MNMPKTVDLVLFAGQSNMSGRGNASLAPICPPGAGYELKPVSRPGELLPLTEPFGLGEDRTGLIDDRTENGGTKRSGSMVTAAAIAYHQRTGRSIAAVSAAIGGSSTAQWLDAYLADALWRLDAAKRILSDLSIGIGHIYASWCQGETDGDHGVSAEDYTRNTLAILESFQAHGAERCFLVQTGHFNGSTATPELAAQTLVREGCYAVIRQAQEDLCADHPHIVLAGSFASYQHLMIDVFHYDQQAYNEVGNALGRAMADDVMRACV